MPQESAQWSNEEVVRAAFDFGDRDRDLYRLFAVTGPKLDAVGTTPTSQVVVSTIQKNLDLDMKAGTVRLGNSPVMAALQFAVVDGAYRSWCKSGDPSRREAYIAEAVYSMNAMLSPIE